MPKRGPKQNIVLTGLSGSGKTALGGRLAAELGLAFVDTDEWVERHTNLRVSQIFSGYGEPFFRQVESEAIRRVAALPGAVIATGGGAVLDQQNVQALAATGVIIFNDRPPERIAADIQLGHRPLLAAGVEKLYTLAEQRRPVYLATADLVLQNRGGLDEALEALLTLALLSRIQGQAVVGEAGGRGGALTALCMLQTAVHSLLDEPTAHRRCAAVETSTRCLGELIAAARFSRPRGLTLTGALRGAIPPLLDELDEQARLCGSAGVVAVRGARLCGGNPDVAAVSELLAEHGRGFAGSRVAVCGAGEIAFETALAAVRQGAARIALVGPSEQTEPLAGRLRAAGPAVLVEVAAAAPIELARAAAECDILLNALPPSPGISPAFLEAAAPQTVLCDLAAPAWTALTDRARSLGLTAIDAQTVRVRRVLAAEEFLRGETLDKPTITRRAAEELAWLWTGNKKGEAAI